MKKEVATIGTRIKELREAKGLRQAQLGEQLSVSDKTISKWEKDKSQPDAESMVALASFFGVTLDYLLAGATASNRVETISKIELACRYDNLALLNGVDLKIPDETGKDIHYYAKQYQAESILKYLDDLRREEEKVKPNPIEPRFFIAGIPEELDGEDNLILLGQDYTHQELPDRCAEFEKRGYHDFKTFSFLDTAPAKYDYQVFCIEFLNRDGFREASIQYWMLDDEASGLLTVDFYKDSPHEKTIRDENEKETVKKYKGYKQTAKSYISPAVLKEFRELLVRLDYQHWIDLPWGCPFYNAHFALAGDNNTLNFRHYNAPERSAYKAFVDGIMLLCMKSMRPLSFKRLVSIIDTGYNAHYREGMPLRESYPLFSAMEREGFFISWTPPKEDKEA